jgi:hypothetical protein
MAEVSTVAAVATVSVLGGRPVKSSQESETEAGKNDKELTPQLPGV